MLCLNVQFDINKAFDSLNCFFCHDYNYNKKEAIASKNISNN